MSQVKPVKTAIIGCGTISHIYMSNLTNKFKVIELVGCSDLIEQRSAKRAAEFGIKQMTNDQILNDPEIELVLNLTYPQAHYNVSKAILTAGKHCVVEKMMTVEFDEAQELCKLAEEKKLLYGAAPDTFLGGGWQSTRKFLDDDIIGKPMSTNAVITCSYQPNTKDFDLSPDTFFFPLHPGGGLPYDLGGYYLHNMINLFGPVTRVSGFGGNIDPKREYSNPHHPKYKEEFVVDTPTTLAGSLEFESGVLGTILISSDSAVEDSFSIQGTQGVLKLFHPNFYSGPITMYRPYAVVDEALNIGVSQEGGYRPEPDKVLLPTLHGYADNNRGLGAADLAYALRNQRKPRIHWEVGLHAMEIIHGIIQSAKTNQVYQMTTSCQRPKPRQTGVDFGTAQEKTLDD